ncbi:MAG: hypothetical protein HYV07_09130 [Deltaproteobacteria bacterium]|nr:hypothetical protein [Deltaproteobacteria bacterium]
MRLVLDSGALIALERGDRAMWRRFKLEALAERVPASHGAIIGQVWRGRGPRQALLAQALECIDVVPLDELLGRAAGELLATARTSDVVDAALVLLAEDGDRIVTSDIEDIERLLSASGRRNELIRL